MPQESGQSYPYVGVREIWISFVYLKFVHKISIGLQNLRWQSHGRAGPFLFNLPQDLSHIDEADKLTSWAHGGGLHY
jgi:hypothetical protein